ncbi:M16 family metallopeptidase [Chloroflexota bacterium]
MSTLRISFDSTIKDGILYQKTTLDNGLRIVTDTMPQTYGVCIGIFIGTGSRYEEEEEAGISHFIEHLLFKGTLKRASSREISETIEGIGGTLNGGTGKESTFYWCKIPKPHLTLALDVLVDIVLYSKFEATEIEKERQVIIEEINTSKDSPPEQVNLLIDDLMWPKHPLGQDIAGRKESVAAITRDQMLGYLSKHYQPNNAVITIAGNIQHQDIVTMVSQAMGNWTSQHPPQAYSSYKGHIVRRLQVEKRDTEQAHLCLALPGLSLLHPRRFTLDLLNVILGGGMSSRLFTEIRDNLGLAYSISSFVEHFLDSGSITVYAGAEPRNLPTVIKAILEQLSKLREAIPEQEVNKAKELSKGRLLLSMEDSRNVASWIGAQEILIKRILNLEQVVAIIDAITAEEIQQLAQDLIIENQLCLAVVGPVGEYNQLENLLKL